MSTEDDYRAFEGSIPELYERYMVPLFFEHYARDLAARVAARKPARVLEIAAGTGVLTRELAAALSPDAVIVATDLNQPMLDHAAAIGATRNVEWRMADAMQLPFGDETFDVVVCQFAVMFFPDKPTAFAEAKRVLVPGGAFVFNVWDRVEENAFAEIVAQAVTAFFADDPPSFVTRIPHGYFARSEIARDLAAGGFARSPALDTLAALSRAESPRIPAIALCQGTPLRNEIMARAPSRLVDVTNAAAAAIERRFGAAVVEGKMQAHVVQVEK